MDLELKCVSCQRASPADSSFCRFCGERFATWSIDGDRPGIQATTSRKRTSWSLLALLTLVAVVGAWAAWRHETPGQQYDRMLADRLGGKARQDEKVRLAEQGVRELLLDPASAQFQDVSVRLSDGVPMFVCGRFNSRNSLGGYTPYKQFIALDGAVLYMEGRTEPIEFARQWNANCSL